MKFSLWTAICAILFFGYSMWLKDNIFKIYFESNSEPYAFNETLKLTICASLQLFEDKCSKSSLKIPKLGEFSCENLERYPLNCLTFEQNTAKFIIEKIQECDESFIFGSNLMLVKYTNTDYIVKNYSADYSNAYLNNGDYCRTFVFVSFVKDHEKNEPKNEAQKVHYQFSLEKLHSPIKVYVNQHQTNLTYFNFHQTFHRYKDEDFWNRRNDEVERVNPDYLGYKDVTEDSLSTGGPSDSSTEAPGNATKSSIGSGKITRTFERYVPMQNLTTYVTLLHTRVTMLPYPYESECDDYYLNSRMMNGKATRSREECVVECHKTKNDYHKFLYTVSDEVELQSGVEKFPDCENYCVQPNCVVDLFIAQKFKYTFDSGEDEMEKLITRPIGERSSPQNKTLNNKMKLQLNDWIKIIRARPVITPLLAINYIFGLLNVFLGMNLVHFNFKLIHVLIKLRNLTFGFGDKATRRKRSDSLPQNYLAGTADWNLALAQYILEKKIRTFVPANRPRCRSSLREKMNNHWKRVKSLFLGLRYEQLVNLNRLFCFYLLIILSIFFGGELLTEMREPQVTYSDLLSAEVSDPISVSFCFDLRQIVHENVNKEIQSRIEDETTQNYKDENYRNSSLSRHAEDLKAKYLNLLYSNYTSGQIDDLTLGLKELMLRAYLGFKEYAFDSHGRNKAQTTVYDMHSLNPVVFFFQNSKCVKFFINRTDFLFVYQAESSFALFDFRVKYATYFIEQDDQLPNNSSTIFKGCIEFKVLRFLNDSSSCMRFEEFGPCKSKEGCVSQYIQAIYTATYKAISVNHPIILGGPNRLLHFHSSSISTQNEQRLECDLKFESPCKKVKFYKFTSGMEPPKEVMINLSNDIHQKSAVNRFKLVEIFNFFLNIASLLFNVNMRTTIDYLILFVLFIYSQLSACFGRMLFNRGRILPTNSKQTRKMNRLDRLVLKNFLNFLKILILFFGFFFHLYYALSAYVFDSQSVRSSSYEDRPTNIRVPNFTFCIGNQFEFVSYLSESQTQIDFFTSIGKFTNKTGNELQSLFPSMRQTLMKIDLKDENLGEFTLDEKQIGELEEKGSFRDLLYVSTFFLEQSKCSTFYLSVRYSSIPFCLYDAMYPIRFEFRKLNKTFHYTMFLFDREKYTFRNPITLTENRDFMLFFDAMKITIDNELIGRTYLANFFTQKKLLTFESQAEYFEYLRVKFKDATNLTTTSIPLPESYFDLPIDNEAFREFYTTELLEHEEEFFFPETEKLLFRSVVTWRDANNLTRVYLIPRFLQQYIDYSKNQSITETILYIGTVLSFWLNTCYIDLFAFIRGLIRSCKCCKC